MILLTVKIYRQTKYVISINELAPRIIKPSVAMVLAMHLVGRGRISIASALCGEMIYNLKHIENTLP